MTTAAPDRAGDTAIPVAAVVVILVFAALFALRVDTERRFWQPETRWNWPDTAQWIGDPHGAEVIHLRRRLSLPAEPRRAFVQVAAVDAFEVQVNGKVAGSSTWIGAAPTAVVDVTRLLRTGDNVVAVSAVSHRSALPALARVLVRWEQSGRWSGLGSDGQWRVDPAAPAQRRGDTVWSETGYDDSAWSAAVVRADPGQPVPVATAELSPALAGALLDGDPAPARIWHPDLRLAPVSFSRTITLEAPRIQGAWLGIGVDGTYRVVVNGWSLPAERGGASRIDVHAIAPLLVRGVNRIDVAVLEADPPRRLAITGTVLTAAGRIGFSGGEDWISGPGGVPARKVDGPAAPAPALTPVTVTPPPAFWLGRWAPAAGLAVATALAAVATGQVFAAACWRRGGLAPALAWRWFAQPFAVAAVVLGGVALAMADPRTAPAMAGDLSLAVPVLAVPVLAASAGWLLIRLAGCRRAGASLAGVAR